MASSVDSENFHQVISAVDGGALVVDGSNRLREVVEAVMDTGRPGKVVVTLDVAKDKKGVVTVGYEVAGKPPKPDTGRSIFFVDRDGKLTRIKPDQLSLRGMNDDDDNE